MRDSTSVRNGAKFQRPSRWWWLGRGAAGVCLAVLWSTVVSIAWIMLGVALYGDLQPALDAISHGPWVPIVFGAYYFSFQASLVGGLVAPLALGRGPLGGRAPVFRSSAAGGAIGTLLAVPYGALIGWLTMEIDPLFTLFGTVVSGTILGILGGWLGARMVVSSSQHS